MRIGIPSGLQHTFVSLVMLALYRIVNQYGTSTIAAYSVAGRIDSFAIIPAMNFSMALSTFVGQNMGANKFERVIIGMKSTLRMTGVLSAIISLFVMVFGRELMAVFSPEPEVIESGAKYLFIVGAFYIVFACMFVINAVFRGSGDTLIPMFITLIALWAVRIPLSWYLSEQYGEIGIWWGIPAGWIVGLILSVSYYYTGNWKKKVVVKPH